MNIIAMVLLLAMCVLALVVDVAVLVGWLRRRPSTNHRRRLRFERVATIVKRWQRRMKKRAYHNLAASAPWDMNLVVGSLTGVAVWITIGAACSKRLGMTPNIHLDGTKKR